MRVKKPSLQYALAVVRRMIGQCAAGRGRRLGLALLQAMLGIVPNAPGGRLYVDPHLPPWLPDMTLLDLRLG
jgi:hypothetical protein